MPFKLTPLAALLPCSLLLLLQSGAQAQPTIYNGFGGLYSWSQPGNWSNGIPDQSSAATINGSATLSSAVEIGSLAGSGNIDLSNYSFTTGYDNSSTSYSGNLQGGFGSRFVKVGAGTLTLSNVGSGLDSLVELRGGTIKAGNADALGENTIYQLSSGTSLDLQNFNTSIHGVSGSGQLLLGSANLTLTSGVSHSGTLEISGTGQIIMNGNGLQSLNGNSSYSGGTTINSGTLGISHNGALGTGDVTLAGGVLLSEATVSLANAMILNSANNRIHTYTHNFSLTGNISGAGGFTKLGTGTLSLSGNNNYLGDTMISAGTLAVTSDNALANGNSRVVNDATLDISAASDVTIKSLAGTGNVILGNANLLLDNASDTFAGNLSGSGILWVQNGTQILTGNNLSTGVTNLAGGASLQIGDGGTTGSVAGNIAMGFGANLIFDRSNDLSYSGAISGSGLFSKEGAGKLTLTGNNPFSGMTHVNAGTLSIAAGAELRGSIVVNNGGTLGGGGVIHGATIRTGGTLAPGSSIGTLTVVDSLLAFQSGSQYLVEVDASGAADRVNVVGSGSGVLISSGSTLNIVAAAGSYANSTSYTLISSANGITGTFDNVMSNLSFLTPTLDYSNTNLLRLTLSRNDVSFAAIARSYNQRNAALGLMSVGAGTLATAVTGLDADSARSAYSQLSGEVHASAQVALVEDTDFVRSAVTQRLYQPDGNAVWFKASSIHGYTDRNSNTDSTTRHMNGGLVGTDRSVGDGNWTAGVFGGYGDTNFNTQRSQADIKTVHLGVYAGRSFDQIQVKLGTGYAYHRLDTSRKLGFGSFTGRDKADYDAHSLQAFADLGYRIKSGDGSIEPFLNLAQVYLSREGFNERGDEAALRVSSEQSRVTLGTIGLRLDQPLSASSSFPLRLQGSLGYRHAEGDVSPNSEARLAGGSSFDIRANPIARQAAVYDLGLYSQLSPAVSAGINYRGQHGDNTRIHAANFNVTWLF